MDGAQERVEDLKTEAKRLLNSLLGFNSGIASLDAERFVDCIVSAAMLQTAILQTQAMKDSIKTPK